MISIRRLIVWWDLVIICSRTKAAWWVDLGKLNHSNNNNSKSRLSNQWLEVCLVSSSSNRWIIIIRWAETPLVCKIWPASSNSRWALEVLASSSSRLEGCSNRNNKNKDSSPTRSDKASAIAIWVPWTKAKVWVVVGLPPQVNSANKTIWLSNRRKCHPSRATQIRRKEEDSSHRLMLALGSKISSQILTRLALSNLLLNQAHQTYSAAALSIWISWVDSQCRIITLVISPSPNPHSTAWPPREVLAKVEWILMHLENKIKVVHPEAQTGATKTTSNKRATPSMALSNSEQKY